jgi:hypothetical protein
MLAKEAYPDGVGIVLTLYGTERRALLNASIRPQPKSVLRPRVAAIGVQPLIKLSSMTLGLEVGETDQRSPSSPLTIGAAMLVPLL